MDFVKVLVPKGIHGGIDVTQIHLKRDFLCIVANKQEDTKSNV